MIVQKFNDLKIGTKIGLGFGIVLVILSIVLTMSINGLRYADDGITTYRGLATDTNLAGRLQANMLMVRMNVKDYLITKSDKDLQQYADYLDRMTEFLEEAKQEIQKPERADLIKKVASSVIVYEESFASVVDLVNQRNTVDSTRLVPNGEAMRSAIAAIVESAYKDNDAVAAYHAAQVQEKMLTGRLFVVKFLQTNDASDFVTALENMDTVLRKELKVLDSQLQNPERRRLLGEFEKAHHGYLAAMNDIQKYITDRNNIIQNKLDVIGPQIATWTEDVKLSVMADQDTLGPQLKENTANSVQNSIVLALVAIVAGISAAYFLTVKITRPIRIAVSAAEQLAQGDLTISVKSDSKDETGVLLNSIQLTADKLKQMIGTISDSSTELASAAEELSVVTQQMSKGIVNQEQETDMVATAMNEMSLTVHNVADNASKAAESANKADQEAVSGSRVVDQTIQSINALSGNVNQSSVKLGEVQQQVHNISSILDVITGIADQTNLLALNAAIEAARAGEQGRGFAVVADEVRSLASRTQGSTLEIQSIIDLLQSGTQSTVDVMTTSKEQAELCVTQAQQAGDALTSITHAITEINDMNTQIASASEEQSSVAEDINANILNVKKIAEENAAASEQTSSSSTEIARLADSLKQLVTQFRV